MKKIKNNSQGFVLAETLVVAVFLMAIFALIYSSFYPLIGEYEKRETYDDIDGKYSAYWVKKLIEDSSYQPEKDSDIDTFFKNNGYIRFECSNITNTDKKDTCINLVHNLQVDGCDSLGNNCEIYITKYQLGSTTKAFKDTIKNSNVAKYKVNCTSGDCQDKYIKKCEAGFVGNSTAKSKKCNKDNAKKKTFRGDFIDYIETLPDYTAASLNGARYRVIISFHHTKDNNNYYSYSTIEVNK